MEITGKKVFERIKNLIEDKYPELDLEKITQAYVLAYESHTGQKRKSGEDYIVHPLEVAEILLDLRMDTDTIVAGILHDVVEDTLITLSDIEYIFGKNVANLVDGVTKLRNLPKKEGKQIENIRKMVVAMSEDVRVVIIKLADRLHNMRTLKYQSPLKQIEKSKESMDIFAPIAHRIGMGKIKTELEDLSFYYLNPENYEEIKNLINSKKTERINYTNKMIEIVKEEMEKVNIKCEISGRPKNLYSIYKKMTEKNKKFEELMDLIAIRIITEKEVDCYAALGIVHSKFPPVPGRFKDYIAASKSNGYQSIHTTVKGFGNQNVEIQIRTEQMHQIAEEGVAAHWKYKEKTSKSKNEEYYAKVKKMIESNIDNFAKKITVEILNKTIFVFTPKGDVIELIEGSTVLDFAFSVHTQIGYKTTGAKVNDKIVPLSHVIKNGDTVEILTSKTAKGPGSDWLNIVNNPSSKSKIKKWFKDKEFESKSKIGEELINNEFSKLGLKFKDYEDDNRVLIYMKKFNIKDFKELCYKFATNQLFIETFINKFGKKEEVSSQITEEEKNKVINKYNHKYSSGLKVTGAENTLFSFPKCCNPLPGDAIKGYVSRGKGIVVHRMDCQNIIKLEDSEKERILDVEWDDSILEKSNIKYQVNFTVKTYGRAGILSEFIKLISESKIDLIGVKTSTVKESSKEYAKIIFSVMIRKKEEFEKLSKNFLNIKEVIEIIRN